MYAGEEILSAAVARLGVFSFWFNRSSNVGVFRAAGAGRCFIAVFLIFSRRGFIVGLGTVFLTIGFGLGALVVGIVFLFGTGKFTRSTEWTRGI